MAIPCQACSRPVHEQVVICPHCAEPTGNPADPIAEVEIAELPRPEAKRLIRSTAQLLDILSPPPREPALPRATARRRRRRR